MPHWPHKCWRCIGVDPTVLAGVMSSEVNNPYPAAAKDIGVVPTSANGYEGGFGTALMLKDLNLAVDAAEEEGLATPVTGLIRDLYRMATQRLWRDASISER